MDHNDTDELSYFTSWVASLLLNAHYFILIRLNDDDVSEIHKLFIFVYILSTNRVNYVETKSQIPVSDISCEQVNCTSENGDRINAKKSTCTELHYE